MASTTAFPFRYGFFRPLLSVLGMGPRFSTVALDGDHLRVRMGWCFRADVPLSSIKAVRPYRGMVYGIGVHGTKGRWLVNGAARGIVEIDIHPPSRARVMGVPIRLRTLRISVESPEELMAALRR
jgi:hypothetical protein